MIKRAICGLRLAASLMLLLLLFVVLGGQTSTAQKAASYKKLPNYDVPLHGGGKYISVRTGRIYYESEGSGSPVILVAGGPGGSHASFHPWFSELAKEHTVIYFDNLGRGRSSRLTDLKGYTVERDAEDIEALRQELGYERISIIGHSYGGMPALAYALKYPNRVSILVLSSTLDSAASWQENIDSYNFSAKSLFPEQWKELMGLRAGGAKSSAAKYQEIYGKAAGDLYWYDPDTAAKIFRSGDTADEFNSDVYFAMIGDDPEWTVGGTMRGYDPRPRMKNLNVRTLVCVGRYDRIATPKVASEIKDALPATSSRLVIFERSSHRPWVEENKTYFKIVGEFLRGGM